ncbi:MAG: HypC/HybG/HupF family hydrogenase formation chaperone [Acidobacteria bacterium]|nr:HypC/HybG/HupF family hydrogenase formation chaperone [Acidobacteriota bacterium]
MCLGIPMLVVEREGDFGTCEVSKVKRKVNFALLPEAVAGDWVIVHAGFAIERVNEKEAEETLKLLSELGR